MRAHLLVEPLELWPFCGHTPRSKYVDRGTTFVASDPELASLLGLRRSGTLKPSEKAPPAPRRQYLISDQSAPTRVGKSLPPTAFEERLCPQRFLNLWPRGCRTHCLGTNTHARDRGRGSHVTWVAGLASPRFGAQDRCACFDAFEAGPKFPFWARKRDPR